MVKMLMVFVILMWLFEFGDGNSLRMGHRSSMEQLYEDLLFSYIPEVRPSVLASDVTMVNFSSYLIQLIDVDEKNQIFSTNLWLEMEWYDHRLSWDPYIYDNVTTIHLPAKSVWTPDIVVYNNAAGKPQITIFTDVLVLHTGKIVWKPPMVVKSFCIVNISPFPYDDQRCFIKFGTWSYDAQYVDLQLLRLYKQPNIPTHNVSNGHYTPVDESDYNLIGMDLSYYYRSAEWDILNITAVRHELIYSGCCGQKIYVDITFNFHLRRLPMFYSANMMFPCALIGLLTLFAYYLPADSRQRITFCISIFVSLSVFFLLLVEIMPATSEGIPIMGKFILFNMINISFTIVVTVLTLNLHHRDATVPMSPWTKKIFIDYLARWLRIGYGYRLQVNKHRAMLTKHLRHAEMVTTTLLDSRVNHQPLIKKRSNSMETNNNDDGCLIARTRNPRRSTRRSYGKYGQGNRSKSSDHDRLIWRTLQHVAFIGQHHRIQHEREEISMDWSRLAMVVDRILLFFVWAYSISYTTYIICEIPYLTEKTKPPLEIPLRVMPLGYAAAGATIV